MSAPAAAASANPAEWRKLIEAESQLAEPKTRRGAVSALNRLVRSRCDATSARSAAVLARAIGEQADPGDRRAAARIEELLKPYSDFAPISTARAANPGGDFRNPAIHPFLERAALDALDPKTVREGMRRFDFALNQTGELDQAFAAFRLAEVLRRLSQLQAAHGRAAESLKTGESFAVRRRAAIKAEDSESEKPRSDFDLDDWARLRPRIQKLIADLDFDLFAEEYGEAYALYVESRRQYYEKNDPAAALEAARKLVFEHSATLYAQAARLLAAKCLERRGDLKAARAELENLLKNHSDSPYRGEASLELGRLALEREWDIAAAKPRYQAALEWFRAARQVRDAVELFGVPANVATVAAPRSEPARLNQWRGIDRRPPEPMEIVTSGTAAWYLDEMERQCLLALGLIAYADGETAAARELFLQTRGLDPNIEALLEMNWPNAFWRLQAACNVDRMIFPRDDRAHIRPRNRLRFTIAEFNFLVENFETAAEMFIELEKDPRATDMERAIAIIGKAKSGGMLYFNQPESKYAIVTRKGMAELERAIGLAGRTPVAAHANYLLGLAYLAVNWEDGLEKKGFHYLETALKLHPNGFFADTAKFNHIMVIAESGDISRAKRQFEKYDYAKVGKPAHVKILEDIFNSESQ